MSNTHHLKSWPQFFKAIKAGYRTHELRRDDRGFAVGDILVLHEFDPNNKDYTGDELGVEVTAMTSFAQPCAVSDEAMNPDFCIMSVRLINRIARSENVKDASGRKPHDTPVRLLP